MRSIDRIVIVGAGLAGARAAAGLRKGGYQGTVTLVGDELERPYQRPPLSKEYLRGDEGRDHVAVHAEGFYAEQRIELLVGTAVEAIEPASREVVLADGRRLPWDRLLLATGARPRRLAVPGANLPGVLSLRTMADADAIRAVAAEAERFVVIGAGWIGSEVAASLRALGRRVTLVAPDPVPLGRVLGPQVGRVYRDLHAEHGVDLRLGTSVERIVGTDRVRAVETSDGAIVPADAVIAGIGVQPRTALAVTAGLAVGDGIEVSASLETSTPGIFAAGDVASAWHPFYERRIRVEHWSNAWHGGAAAAGAMLGSDAPYDRIPSFFSDQYDLSMEYTGVGDGADGLIVRGRLDDRRFIAFWLSHGRVVAGMNANVPKTAKAIERLVRARVVVDPAALADPAIPLEELAGDPVAA